MRRALGKPHFRVLGIDDGSFARTDRTAPLVAVAISAPDHVEGILRSEVQVDGWDATERMVALLRDSRYLEGARALLLDGVSFGGFNVVDLGRLARALRRPVVSVTRDRPEWPSIRAALRKHFPIDGERRWRRLRAHPLFRVPTDGEPLWAAAVGCTRAEARELLARTTVRGFWPEPLRVAHLIAHAIGTPIVPPPGAAHRAPVERLSPRARWCRGGPVA